MFFVRRYKRFHFIYLSNLRGVLSTTKANVANCSRKPGIKSQTKSKRSSMYMWMAKLRTVGARWNFRM